MRYNKNMSKKKQLFFAAVAVLSIAILAGAALTNRVFIKPQVVQNAQSTQAAVYYPSALPSGYTVDQSSLSQTSSATVYIIKTASELLNVSIQPQPDRAIIEKFEKEQLGLPETINNVTIGQIRGRLTASMQIDDNWIILTGPTTMKYADFVAIATSFKK